MKSQRFKPVLLNRRGQDLSLSGPVLIDLLAAVLEKGARFRFQAKGFSMSPFIKDGDVVTVSPLSECSLGLGDVVAFINPAIRNLVVHRLVGKRGNSYLIKGDNTAETDGSIAKTNILGCVTKVERNGKRVFLGLGPERFLLSILTRTGLLFPLLNPMWRLVRPIFRLNR